MNTNFIVIKDIDGSTQWVLNVERIASVRKIKTDTCVKYVLKYQGDSIFTINITKKSYKKFKTLFV